MHPFLEHQSLAARREIAKLREACVIELHITLGSQVGWVTVKRYASEIVEDLCID